MVRAGAAGSLPRRRPDHRRPEHRRRDQARHRQPRQLPNRAHRRRPDQLRRQIFRRLSLLPRLALAARRLRRPGQGLVLPAPLADQRRRIARRLATTNQPKSRRRRRSRTNRRRIRPVGSRKNKPARAMRRTCPSPTIVRPSRRTQACQPARGVGLPHRKAERPRHPRRRRPPPHRLQRHQPNQPPHSPRQREGARRLRPDRLRRDHRQSKHPSHRANPSAPPRWQRTKLHPKRSTRLRRMPWTCAPAWSLPHPPRVEAIRLRDAKQPRPVPISFSPTPQAVTFSGNG